MIIKFRAQIINEECFAVNILTPCSFWFRYDSLGLGPWYLTSYYVIHCILCPKGSKVLYTGSEGLQGFTGAQGETGTGTLETGKMINPSGGWSPEITT